MSKHSMQQVHNDMPSRRTVDHDEIKRWVELHGGRPTALRTSDGDLGVVRIAYAAQPSPMQPITWEEFFEQFEGRKLAFVYDPDIPRGEEQRRTKLINRGS